ncbi:MAG: ISAzo13 family transposase [bacterium]
MATRRTLAASERSWLKVLGVLNELQARLLVAQRAQEMGRGGIQGLATLTGMSRATIAKGLAELRQPTLAAHATAGRIRRPGGGRHKVEDVDPGVTRELARRLAETTAGDPMSSLKWTSKSTHALAAELSRRGHPVTAPTVARCLHDMGYALQINQKALEGKQHPDRDAQFRYLNARVKTFLRTRDPVVSVDTKKKELVGQFRNPGRTWRPHRAPRRVFTHDFPHLGAGKAIPYGTYDIGQNQALVNVGMSHDTAEFAVESIRRWWRLLGRHAYPQARRLLISADAGGSNGHRPRAWKLHLQRLADDLALPITVCHYPPGTSKWNKIEHRLFSFISLTWKGQPLVSYETVVNLIGRTRTRGGLTVKAVLDRRQYATGQKVTAAQLDTLQLKGHPFHPDWNYTLVPHTSR